MGCPRRGVQEGWESLPAVLMAPRNEEGGSGELSQIPPQKKNQEHEGFVVSIPTLLASPLPAEGLIAPSPHALKLWGRLGTS